MKLGRKLNIKEIKDMELDILVKFKEFCDKENLKFYLAYGTLLGAVRHKGFIPWDDDIDVMMIRKDYDKLIHLLREKEISKNISASCYELDKTSLPFMKVYRNDTYTSCRAKSVHRGVWIDVFCMDNINPRDKKKLVKSRRCMKLLICKLVRFQSKEFLKFIVKVCLKLLLLPVPEKFFVKKIIKYSKTYMDTDTEYCGVIAWGEGTKDCFKKEDILNDTAYLPFEGYDMPVPLNYDQYLTQIYGDYMKIPDVRHQESHNFNAYMKKAD